MANSAPSDDWFNAASATADGFTYSGGEFFAEASGQKRHRRHSPAELRALVMAGNDKFHPAHWFEAQLLHYGLKPSKTKSVARMRLSDAVNAGDLQVPEKIVGLEKRLKEQWMKESAKMARGESSNKGKATKATMGTKRKIEETDAVFGSAKTKGKKAKLQSDTKTTPTKSAKKAAVKATPKPKMEPTAKTALKSEAVPVINKRVKQTARRGAFSQISSRRVGPAPTAEPPPSERRAYARRGRANMARGRIPTTLSQPPHSENYGTVDDDDEDDDGDGYPPSSPSDSELEYPEHPGDESDIEVYDFQNATLESLGLLNGNYNIMSPTVNQEWPDCGGPDFDLTLTLDGSRLWGKFNFGVVEGIMFFEERPRKSSHDEIPFIWRGREDQGPIMYGDSNEGWIRFLGDGRIEGELDYQKIDFRGRRMSGQGRRSVCSASEMRREWENYSEDTYEYENRSRWGSYYGAGW